MHYSSLFSSLLVLVVVLSGCTGQTLPPAHAVSPVVAMTEQPIVSGTPVIQQTILDTTWKLGWYDDTKGIWSSVISGSTITATFGDNEKVTGSGGCNKYSTDFHLGNTPMLWIRRPVESNGQCSAPTGVMHQESAFFTDLSRSQNYSISNGQLLIFDSANRRILQFDPSKN